MRKKRKNCVVVRDIQSEGSLWRGFALGSSAASKLNSVILHMRNHLNLRREKISETLNCDDVPRGFCCSNSVARGESQLLLGAQQSAPPNPRSHPTGHGDDCPSSNRPAQPFLILTLISPWKLTPCPQQLLDFFSFGKNEDSHLVCHCCLVAAADPGIRIWQGTFYQL